MALNFLKIYNGVTMVSSFVIIQIHTLSNNNMIFQKILVTTLMKMMNSLRDYQSGELKYFLFRNTSIYYDVFTDIIFRPFLNLFTLTTNPRHKWRYILIILFCFLIFGSFFWIIFWSFSETQSLRSTRISDDGISRMNALITEAPRVSSNILQLL